VGTQRRHIGRLDVSVVGVGCNNFGGRIDADRSVRVVHAALDEGINLFDTADVYSGGASEEALGRALRQRRDEAVVATKFGARMPDGSSGARPDYARPDYARSACEASLRRLGMDHIDLYQLHFPDGETPIGGTLGALSELIDAGKVAVIGCSNFSADQFDWAQRTAADLGVQRFASVQNQLSLVHEEGDHSEMVANMEEHGTAFLPYFPLASGVLTGKYTRGEDPGPSTRLGGSTRMRQRWMTDEYLQAAERLEAWARQRDRTLLELAVSWLAAQPRVASVIAGATSPEQVAANAAVVDWKLTDSDLREILQLRPADARS
jgi:aryl-alcohol dehydrogenase-like predicted oxidoreductase